MNLPSASSLQRAMACVGSAVLPRVQNVSAKADLGTEVHALLDRHYKGEKWEDILKSEMSEGAKLHVADIEPEKLPLLEQVETEVAYAFNPFTGKARCLGHHIGRNYNVENGEFPMTLDLKGRSASGRLMVADVKTGTYEVPPPLENWQLRVAAVAVAEADGVDEVEIAIVHTSGGVTWEPFLLTAAELNRDRQLLKGLAQRIVSAQTRKSQVPVPVTTGEHCKFCPSYVYCPAQNAIIRRAAGEPIKTVEDLNSMLTPETAALAFKNWQVFKEAMRRMEGAFRFYADSMGGIPTEEGKVWGPDTVLSDELDPEVVYEVLKTRYSPEVAKSAMTLESSKAGLERALKPLAEKGEKAGLIREVLAEIQQKGGVRTKAKVEFRARKPREESNE